MTTKCGLPLALRPTTAGVASSPSVAGAASCPPVVGSTSVGCNGSGLEADQSGGSEEAAAGDWWG
jgi:hypothetical protein